MSAWNSIFSAQDDVLTSLLILGLLGKPDTFSPGRGMMALWKRPLGQKEEVGLNLSASACIHVTVSGCRTCSQDQKLHLSVLTLAVRREEESGRWPFPSEPQLLSSDKSGYMGGEAGRPPPHNDGHSEEREWGGRPTNIRLRDAGVQAPPCAGGTPRQPRTVWPQSHSEPEPGPGCRPRRSPFTFPGYIVSWKINKMPFQFDNSRPKN